MGSQVPQPELGFRLLPKLVDEIARDDPGRVMYYAPIDNRPLQGYDEITAARFSNAVNKLSWWLESELNSKNEFKTFGYLGQNDLKYFLIMLAATKTGNKVLLSSPRNSPEGHKHLAKQAGCEFWCISSGVDKYDFIGDTPLVHVPELIDLLDPAMVAPYPYEKTFEQGHRDLLVYLHTSGSTGLPKLIPIYLGTAATMDAQHIMEPVNGVYPNAVVWKGTKLVCAMPLFHIAAILVAFYGPIFFNMSIILPPTGPLMQHVVEESLDSIDATSAFISPSVLQDISKSPSALAKLAKLNFITTAGAPVAKDVGDLVNPLVPIHQTYGSTEAGWVAPVIAYPDEWQYHYFHPANGPRFIHQSAGLYELELVKDPQLAATQSIFTVFPDLDVWKTKDLFSKHPTIPNLWKYEMRADDLIVLSNGEKFNPLVAEGALIQDPWIAAAYITGRGRFQAAVLINPSEAASDVTAEDFIDKIWPTVERVNAPLPAFAQLHRDFIRVIRTPLPRTPKMTVFRPETERVYSKLIDEIYEAPVINGDASLEVNLDSQEGIRDGIREAVKMISGRVDLDDLDNIFAKGFDSLLVIRLERILKSAFNGRPLQVDASLIYLHPSIASLASAIWKQVQHGDVSAPRETFSSGQATLQMINKYSASFGRDGEHVVITGTTGSIGSYLLDTLCRSGQVESIWCLNRSSDAQEKQTRLALAKGLSTQGWSGKVRFLQWDPSSDALGLSQAVIAEIAVQATVIIHNAWEVNFNLPLSSFESQIVALRGLVNICRTSRHKIRFYLTSSVSTAMNWPSDKLGPVPEGEISDFEASINGYGASKLVAEHLLRKAADSDLLSFSSLRLGQAAGPVKTRSPGGAWNRKEWVPSLINASAYLGLLPADLGSATALDWIPVDHLAEIMGELVLCPSAEARHVQERFYNILNPHRSSWSDLVPTIKERLERATSTQIQVVPLQQWVDALLNAGASIIREADQGSSEKAKNAQPGLALAGFYKGLVRGDSSSPPGGMGNLEWIMTNSMSQSRVLTELPPVSATWFGAWLDQWGYGDGLDHLSKS